MPPLNFKMEYAAGGIILFLRLRMWPRDAQNWIWSPSCNCWSLSPAMSGRPLSWETVLLGIPHLLR